MKGPRGERLGDPLEGEDHRRADASAYADGVAFNRPVALIVVGTDDVERPGYVLRAGDLITRTHYDHDRRTVTAHVGERPLPLRLRIRRWWEGLWG